MTSILRTLKTVGAFLAFGIAAHVLMFYWGPGLAIYAGSVALVGVVVALAAVGQARLRQRMRLPGRWEPNLSLRRQHVSRPWRRLLTDHGAMACVVTFAFACLLFWVVPKIIFATPLATR